MASAGHTAWVIRLFGRWGSDTVLRHVREALLGRKAGGSLFCSRKKTPGGPTLDDVHAHLGIARGVIRDQVSGGLPSDVLALENVAFRQPVMSEGGRTDAEKWARAGAED